MFRRIVTCMTYLVSSALAVPVAAEVEPAAVPANPHLATSASAMAHRNSAQQNSSNVAGPDGPTRTLSEDEIDWTFTGPAHFVGGISSIQADGRRVFWSAGGDRIVKLDMKTFKLLAELPLPERTQMQEGEAVGALENVERAPAATKPAAALALTERFISGFAGVYTVLDRDGAFYVGDKTGITAYGDAVSGKSDSSIVVLRRWDAPASITAPFVGMNLTYDGWLVLVSEVGDVVALSRDFTKYHAIKLRHSEDVPAYLARVNAPHNSAVDSATKSWVRNSFAVDDRGGIYILSAGYVHKVIWTGEKLSVDEADGAWSEPYPDDTGVGSGATPVLMGFGPAEDHLVVFTDGNALMNVTAYWRDDMPSDWRALPGAPSRRMAGSARADMGDPNATSVQTEQAAVVSGYGALVVNNSPASPPAGIPPRTGRLLAGLIGNDPRFTPYGLQKFQWNPMARRMELAWTNRDVSSPNAVPFVSSKSKLAYTVGTRDGKWTLEGIDWKTGKSRFFYFLPGPKYNSFFAGLMQDDEGNILFGSPLGKVRIRK